MLFNRLREHTIRSAANNTNRFNTVRAKRQAHRFGLAICFQGLGYLVQSLRLGQNTAKANRLPVIYTKGLFPLGTQRAD